MKKLLIATAVLSALTLSGCSQRIADLTVASTKNIDLNSDQFTKGGRVSGKDSKQIIIIIPTGTPNIEAATDEAIEKDRCAVGLSDVTVEYTWFYIPYLFGNSEYTIEGNQIIDRSLDGCENWQYLPANYIEKKKTPTNQYGQNLR